MRSETMTSGRNEWLLYGIDKRSYDDFDDRKIRYRIRGDLSHPAGRNLCGSGWSIFLFVFRPTRRIDRSHAYSNTTPHSGGHPARSKGFSDLTSIIFFL